MTPASNRSDQPGGLEPYPRFRHYPSHPHRGFEEERHHCHSHCCPPRHHCECHRGPEHSAGILPFLASAPFRYLGALAFLKAEAAAAVPVMVERAICGAAFPWRGHEGFEEDDCCREEHRCCQGCGESAHNCRCDREEREHGTADIRLSARPGDTLSKVILVENNGPRPLDIKLTTDPWISGSGNETAAAITFTPAELTLAPGEAKETIAQVAIPADLTGGFTNFTRIRFEGSRAYPISVQLSVAPPNRIDYYAQADPCRPRRGHFVDFHHESDCGDPDCGRCHHQDRHREGHDCGCHQDWGRERHDCGGSRHYGGDPWFAPWIPFRWPGFGLCHSWHDAGRWDRFVLPPLRGGCC